jgi:hypothetical protein
VKALGSEPALVTHLIGKMGRGSSQPFLAKADDGTKYVVKFAQEGCANFLFNECLGSDLYDMVGLMCPPWRPLVLTDEFLDQNTGCWIEGNGSKTRPPAGLCFGSQFLGDSLYQMLPGSWYKRLQNPFDFWRAWFLDICAEHYDTRQALFHERENRRIQPWFIDHGYMFGGPDDRVLGKTMAPRFLDSRIYEQTPLKRLSAWVRTVQSLDPDVFWTLLEPIPGDWKTPKALSAFTRFLTRITDKDFGAVIVQRMDLINNVFLRLRSEGQPAWLGHCYGHFYPTGSDQADRTVLEAETLGMD